jgi:hypothetical protein
LAPSQSFLIAWEFDVVDATYDPVRYADKLAALVPGLDASDVTITVLSDSASSGADSGSGDAPLSVGVTVAASSAGAAAFALQTLAALSADEVAAEVEATGPAQLVTAPAIVEGPSTPPSPPASPSPSPPMPFQPVSAGEVWVGTISFEVLVLARRRRLADVSRDEVSRAVTTVLGMRGLQLGDETLSVTAAALAALDDGRQRFVLTVMALGPYMQRISELVRELDFRDEVESELSATVTVGKPGEVTFTTQLAASLSPPPTGPKRIVEIQDSEGDDISAKGGSDDGLPGWAIFLLVLLFLCCLWPLCCCCYARGRYGAGTDAIWLRYKTTHSNTKVPFRYMAHEHRERMHQHLLRSQKKDKQQEGAFANVGVPSASCAEAESSASLGVSISASAIRRGLSCAALSRARGGERAAAGRLSPAPVPGRERSLSPVVANQAALTRADDPELRL